MKTGFGSAVTQFSFAGAVSKTKSLLLILTTRHRRIVQGVACLASFLFLGSLSAQPLSVAATSTQYMTYVQGSAIDANGVNLPPVSRTTFSASPISDELDLPNESGLSSFGIIGTNYAIANAGLFQVSDRTGWGIANAEAVSQLWFSPLADQTQMLNFQILADGRMGDPAYTSGQISLFDLTANSEVWSYNWDWHGATSVPVPVPSGDNIPWDSMYPANADFSLDTDLLASHQYELTMIVCSNAGDDSESAQIQLTGLQVVPEPSSVCLILVALLGLAAARQRARN